MLKEKYFQKYQHLSKISIFRNLVHLKRHSNKLKERNNTKK